MPILNNVEVGILTKVNELAARYGVEPCDFVAELQPEQFPSPALNGRLDATGRTLLSYTILPAEASKRERFELMLETIGISASTGEMAGSDQEIFQALNKALALAPRGRERT